ncbi:MAG: hypothetical protein Q7T48_16365 [Cellvibrio sp.]|uniref:hypothetical protein n=1 Tax=Cellvibrio sp. TaxID=1965322 RepID=UPI002716C596|nr:hypothetical protein [Cellvibrio sp.]
MKLTLLLISSIGYISLIGPRLGVKFSTAQFLYVALVVVCLYVFGVFGFLHSGVIVITIVGLCGFVFTVVNYFKHGYKLVQAKKHNEVFLFQDYSLVRKLGYSLKATPKLVLLLIHKFKNVGWNFLYIVPFIILYRLISEDYLFTGWDEFSHWALSIKIVYESDSLYLKDTPMMYKHYPPIQQLFQYYYLQFGGWSERNVIFSQGIFVLSALVCVTGRLFKNTSFLAISTFTASCIVLYYFGYDLSHIYVDPLLATVFASCLILAISEDRGKGALLLSLCLPVLVLIKQTGLILALVVLAVYAANSFWRNCHQFVVERNPKSRVDFQNTSLSIALVLLSIVLSFKSWDWYLLSINSAQSFNFPSLTQLFEPPMLGQLGMTVVEFLKRINTGDFLNTGSPLHRFSLDQLLEMAKSIKPFKFFWIIFNEVEYSSKLVNASIVKVSFVLIVLSALSALFYRKGSRINLFALLAIIAIGCVGYLFFLLLSYLFFFKEIESIALASFERYVATYYLAWFLVIFSVVFSSADRLKSRLLKAIFIGSLFLVFIFAPPQFFRDLRGIVPPPKLLEARKKVDELAGVAKTHMGRGDGAYFIIQNSSGFEKYIFNYSILPFKSSWWCWSVGSKYNGGDVWTCDSKLVDLLRGYNVLVIFNADGKFWKENNYLLDELSVEKSSGIYKIIEVNNVVTKISEIVN